MGTKKGQMRKTSRRAYEKVHGRGSWSDLSENEKQMSVDADITKKRQGEKKRVRKELGEKHGLKLSREPISPEGWARMLDSLTRSGMTSNSAIDFLLKTFRVK